jgi:hypothetical protein
VKSVAEIRILQAVEPADQLAQEILKILRLSEVKAARRQIRRETTNNLGHQSGFPNPGGPTDHQALSLSDGLPEPARLALPVYEYRQHARGNSDGPNPAVAFRSH